MSLAKLDDMISSLRNLSGEDFVASIAKEAALLVDEAIKETARAGQAPDGTPWPPRKKDGARALEHVADQIETKAYGPIVRTTLSGPAVFSHFGAGIPRRQVIPDSAVEIPDKVQKALEEGAEIAFQKAMGGGK